jgi:hypothetical protein
MTAPGVVTFRQTLLLHVALQPTADLTAARLVAAISECAYRGGIADGDLSVWYCAAPLMLIRRERGGQGLALNHHRSS